jgi:hypothetical protein
LQRSQISHEHITNNKEVRKTLLERGIRPETLAPSEDVKKVEPHFIAKSLGSIHPELFFTSNITINSLRKINEIT